MPAPSYPPRGADAVPVEAGVEPREYQARLRLVRLAAVESGDPAALARLEREGEAILDRVGAGDRAGAEAAARALEAAVGIDPGGWSVAGQPLYRPTEAMVRQARGLVPALDRATRAGDAPAVAVAVAALAHALGEQAGRPETRRRGHREPLPPVVELDRESALDLALTVLMTDPTARLLGIWPDGEPHPRAARLPAVVVAAYLRSACELRSWLGDRRPDGADALAPLIRGAATLLRLRQRDDGFVAPPGAPGGNGSAPDPHGASQCDTGLSGSALLLAGAALGQPSWTDAGLRAADWAAAQPSVAHFTYNAFSVGLLVRAARASGRPGYGEAAARVLAVGVVPGQLDHGRWIDPRAARTLDHLALVGALYDGLDLRAGSADHPLDGLDLAARARRGVASLLDEVDALGLAYPGAVLDVLLRHRALGPATDPRVGPTIARCAALIHALVTAGRKPQLAVDPVALTRFVAAVPDRAPNRPADPPATSGSDGLTDPGRIIAAGAHTRVRPSFTF